ncbi:MAG: 4Fe-4S binding protein, partial [Rectinemataceae bacterium]
MKTSAIRKNPRDNTVPTVASVFVFFVAIGGIFVPEIGLVLAALMVAAIVMTLRKPRSFCSTVCPRGKALGFIMRRPSKRKALPRFMLSIKFRRLLCGSMMFCVIGSLVRTGGEIRGVGTVFWALCAISLSTGLLMGYFFKPRSWCAICPMGTLQDTISR